METRATMPAERGRSGRTGIPGVRRAGHLGKLASGLALLFAVAPWASRAADDSAIASPRPVVKQVRFTGVAHVSEDQLRAAIRTRPGEPFDADVVAEDARAIERVYRESGYPLACVASTPGIGDDGVVTFPVEEGRIEKVVVKGARKTRRHVITRQLESCAGQVYSRPVLARDRARLYELGFFESVAMVPTAGSEPGKAVLTVDVKERLTGSVAAAVGYASSAGLVGFLQCSDTNVLGLGQALYLNWQRGTYGADTYLPDGTYVPGRLRTGFDLGWHSPWVFSREVSAGLRYFDTGGGVFSYFGQDAADESLKYYEWRRGTWLTLAHEMRHGLSLGLLARREHVDYALAPPEVAVPEGASTEPVRVSSLRLSLARAPMNLLTELQAIPRSGVSVEVGWSEAGGRKEPYQKVGVTSTHYLALSKKDTLAARVQLGWGFGHVPLSEMYAVGGAQTLRSYTWSRFLGTRMLVMNTEWRRQLKPGLAGALFLDLGYAWPGSAALSLSDLRPAVGVGLRITTPFGPMRLDYAFGRDGGRAHLTTGDRF